jgi:hypothetical protein
MEARIDCQIGSCRHRTPQAWQFCPYPLDCLDHVCARLPLDVEHDRRLTAIPGTDLGVLQSVDYIGEVADLDRRAVAEGHHDVPVSRGGGDLIVG